MEKKKIIIIAIIIVCVIAVFFIVNSKNKLSSKDTFDTFIRLVEEGEYEKAKKYTTNNVTVSLSNIKDLKISSMKKDYNLSSENKYVYRQNTKIANYNMEDIYTFELKETFMGWKIDSFKQDINDKLEEDNQLVDLFK